MYSNGRTTFFLLNHFILFPWQAYFWGVLILVFMNSFAHFCHDCVWEGRYEKGVKEHQHCSTKQSFRLISSLPVKKDTAARLTTQIWHQHNLILNFDLFFVHVWFDMFRMPKMPKASSLKQIGSGRIRRPEVSSVPIRSIYLIKANDLVMQCQSICVIWARICWLFLGCFFQTVLLVNRVTFKFVCSNRDLVTRLQIQISRTLLWSIWCQVLQGVKGVRYEMGSSPFVQVFENKKFDHMARDF